MSFLSRTLSAAAASLLLSSASFAAGPLQAELLHLDLPLMAAASSKTQATTAPQGAPVAASVTTAAAPRAATPQRTRAEVIAELRAARAAGQLNHAEAEIGWPVNGRAPR